MTDVVEDFVREVVDRVFQGDALDRETVEKSYFLVKSKTGLSEPDEQSKKWCEFIYDRLSFIDLSKRDLSVVRRDSLIREIYALIAK